MSIIQALIGSFSNVLGAVYRVLHSLRFDGSGDYLINTLTTTGNRKTFTYSCWVKRSTQDRYDYLFASTTSTTTEATLRIGVDASTDNLLGFYQWSGSYAWKVKTTSTITDTEWHHVVLAVDTNQTTDADKVKIYLDGSLTTHDGASTYMATGADTNVNLSGNDHGVGGEASWGEVEGQLAEVHFIDGTAYDASYFGETRGGQWVPKEVTGVTYGTNGFYLDFADSSTASALGTDATTNTNNFTVNGAITPDDQLIDSPNLRFATWDTASVAVTLSEGNLKTTHGASDEAIASESSALVGGKFYCELYWATGTNLMPQVRAAPAASEYSGYFNDGYKYGVEGAAAYGSSYGVGSIIGCAVDATTSKVWWRLNGVWQGTGGGDPSSTLVPATSSGFTGDPPPPLYFALSDGTTADSTDTSIANFGQDHTFAGSKSPLASPFTDDDGNGEFYYQPPAGFKALATSY